MQGTLERTLSAITGERIQLAAAGRTDAGAHALQQTVAFATASSLPASDFLRALNAMLPRDIAVTSAVNVPWSFHPRASARSRTYRYLIWNRPARSPFWEERSVHVKLPLDEARMETAAQHLLGTHDFSAFVPASLERSRVRRIDAARCAREGHMVTLELQGSGFLRQMIRSIAGTLIRVGMGKMDNVEFARILEQRDRRATGNTAPACGLYLVDVQYDSEHDITQSVVRMGGLVKGEEQA